MQLQFIYVSCFKSDASDILPQNYSKETCMYLSIRARYPLKLTSLFFFEKGPILQKLPVVWSNNAISGLLRFRWLHSVAAAWCTRMVVAFVASF